MQEYGIDGVFLQHFVVDLPGGTLADRYASRKQVLHHVAEAARKTGRVWALTYDISGMPSEKIYDVLTADWTKLVDDGLLPARGICTKAGCRSCRCGAFTALARTTP